MSKYICMLMLVLSSQAMAKESYRVSDSFVLVSKLLDESMALSSVEQIAFVGMELADKTFVTEDIEKDCLELKKLPEMNSTAVDIYNLKVCKKLL